MEENKFLKRGKGKNTGNIKRQDFYKYYQEQLEEKALDKSLYSKVLKDLLSTYGEEIVTKGLELKLNRLGKIRVKSNSLKFFNRKGEKIKSLRPNWKATWDYWHIKYPGLSKNEIVELDNKPIIYHENDHSNQEFYEHHWDKLTVTLKNKNFYNFKPSRKYSRLIAEVVKDPNRITFYYG